MTSPTGPQQPQFHLEIETKLEVPADAVLPDPLRSKAVRKAGLASAAPTVVHALDATYYDTENLDLLRSKVTLRRRTGGDDAGWHLKLPGGATAAGARTEVQLPLGRGSTVPAELVALVRGTARGRELKPVARLQNERTVVRLLDADDRPAVEIADDAVTATRPGENTVDRWREVEVELIDGDADQLAATVNALTEAGARPAGRASKLARALPLPAVSWPKPKTAAAAILGALNRHRDKLITADRALRQRTTDSVHDARAAGRRIRSVLRVYEALFSGESVDSLRDRLQDLGQILGMARDLDVVRARLAAGLTEEPEEFGRASGALIQVELNRRATAAMEQVQACIDGPEYLQLLRDLDEFLLHAPLTRRGNRSAATELPLQLGRAWRRLRALSDAALADPDKPTAVHAVRKAAKTVRYAAESTISVLGDDAVLFAAALEEVQEVLGEYQDAQITARILVEVAAEPNTDGIAGFTFGRLHAMEQAIAAGAVEDFADAWDRVDDADLAIALAQD